YVPAGYLWIAEDEPTLDSLRAARGIQHGEGLNEAVHVSSDEIWRLQPAIAHDGVRGGAFCPTDGFIRPRAIRDGYLSAAIRRGVRVELDEAVVALERKGGSRVTAVRT